MTMPGVPTCNPVAGFSNAPLGSFGARFPSPMWPGSFYSFMNDFDYFTAGLAASVAKEEWLATVTNTTLATALVTDAMGGILSITNTAADDDAFIAQYRGGNFGGTVADVVESFQFTPGKELFFASRFSLADVVQSDFMIGLLIGGATFAAATDGVFFIKSDGSAVMSLRSAIVTPVVQTIASTTLVNGVFVEAAFHYNGIDAITAYIDGQRAGTLNIASLPTRTLAVTFGLQNGEAVAKNALVDWIYVARER